MTDWRIELQQVGRWTWRAVVYSPNIYPSEFRHAFSRASVIKKARRAAARMDRDQARRDNREVIEL